MAYQTRIQSEKENPSNHSFHKTTPAFADNRTTNTRIIQQQIMMRENQLNKQFPYQKYAVRYNSPCDAPKEKIIQKATIAFNGEDANDTQQLLTDATSHGNAPVTTFPSYPTNNLADLHLFAHGNQEQIFNGNTPLTAVELANHMLNNFKRLKQVEHIELHSCMSAAKTLKRTTEGKLIKPVEEDNNTKKIFAHKLSSELRSKFEGNTKNTGEKDKLFPVTGYRSRTFTDSNGQTRVLIPWGKDDVAKRYKESTPEPDVSALEKEYRDGRNRLQQRNATRDDLIAYENQHLATAEKSKIKFTA